MTRRQLLAFKRAPTVELRLDDLHVEVTANRVHVSIGGDATVWFSWQEWCDFARRIEHSIEWIETHTPADVTGSSFTVEETGDE